MAAAEKVTIRRTPGEEGDICGSKAAAKIMGVERTRIARWQRMDLAAEEEGELSAENRMLPKEISRLPSGPVWLRSEMEAKAEERKKAAAPA